LIRCANTARWDPGTGMQGDTGIEGARASSQAQYLRTAYVTAGTLVDADAPLLP